jgi:hypothetical protein
MTEVTVSRLMLRDITTAGARHDQGKATSFMRDEGEPVDSAACGTHRG